MLKIIGNFGKIGGLAHTIDAKKDNGKHSAFGLRLQRETKDIDISDEISVPEQHITKQTKAWTNTFSPICSTRVEPQQDTKTA